MSSVKTISLSIRRYTEKRLLSLAVGVFAVQAFSCVGYIFFKIMSFIEFYI